MLPDYHVHLERGPYTLEWLGRFLERAKEVGVAELGIVEHLYRFKEASSLLQNDFVRERQTENLGDFLALMTEAKQRGWPVKVGLEVDYVPGLEKETRQLLEAVPLDFVIGSVHWLGDWGFDVCPTGWEGRDIRAAYEEYFDTLARAAESSLFNIIGHPGNIGYFGHQPSLRDLEHMESAFVARVAKRRKNVVLEVNTGGLLRPARSLFPRVTLLRKIRAAGIDVVLSSDAHQPEDVGHAFQDTLRVLKEIRVECLTVYKNRKGKFIRLPGL